MQKICLGLCGILLGVLLTACSDKELPKGTVASVNGMNITFDELQSTDDISESDFMFNDDVKTNFSGIEELKTHYGQVLLRLIAEKLMLQELEKQKSVPSELDVMRVEKEARADYGKDEFEQMLKEEYIDPTEWHRQIKHRLLKETFRRRILEPLIMIPDEAIKQYYITHGNEFTRSEYFDFTIFTFDKKSDADKSHAAFANNLQQAVKLQPGKRNRMAKDRLPAEWADALQKSGKNAVTEILKDGNGYTFLMLNEIVPGGNIPLAEVAPRIKRILTDANVNKVYQNWLVQTLKKAKIRVAASLLPMGKPSE